MEININEMEKHLPYYLTQERKVALMNELKKFKTRNIAYYEDGRDGQIWQGDGWTHLIAINFSNCEKTNVNGIILSNTCDISTENSRALPYNILFAPILKFDKYINLLKEYIDEEKVKQKVISIKNQEVTSIFFLPAYSDDNSESIVLLDSVHSMPINSFSTVTDKTHLFSLSLVGFYLFLFKLSIHFCRFHEEIDRSI